MSQQEASLAKIKGVGPAMVEKLHTQGIESIQSLVEYFPYRYENYELIDIHTAKHDEKVTIAANVLTACSVQYYGKMKARMQFNVMVNQEVIKVVMFNRQFLKDKIKPQTPVVITGKWDLGRQMITATELHFGAGDDRGLEPVYSLKEIPVKTFQKIVKQTLSQFPMAINDDLPQLLQEKYRLLSAIDAITFAHFPQNKEQLHQMKRRIKYEELFKFQLRMQYLRHQIKKEREGAQKTFEADKVQAFIKTLPFELTAAQQNVVDEILRDLLAPARMYRLLQGDVGSGKTVVAAISLYAAILAGYQVALMVPTEILGTQHFASLQAMFEPFKEVNVAFLSGSVKGRRRKEVLAQLASGEINLLVGTHALIQPDVHFSNLGLVITDEQHRFGVNQRKVLREKGDQVDVLMMTATPIPRTLAISVFGDMDVSVINQLPQGRKPIETFLINNEKLNRALTFIETEMIEKGGQAYVITPLIEESEQLDVENAVEVYEKWQDYFKGRARVGLMHGRLTQAQKDEVMAQFAANEIQILVSTTVIEVGVNVPNANAMLIYDAHRFGLSQLHQLRGRVGRGATQAYCILLSDSTNEASLERLKIMTKTTDGFELSEFDLKLRGPGDFFGEKQSGLPQFKMADIIEDFKILEVAMQDANELLQLEEFFVNNEYLPIRQYLEQTVANEAHVLD